MKKINLMLLTSIFFLASCATTQKVEKMAKVAKTTETMASKRQTPLKLYVTAKEAYTMLKNNPTILFLDVRTRAEIAFLGMPTMVDANIPYMLTGDFDTWDEKKKTFKLPNNSNFLPYLEDYMSEHGYRKDSKIILMCRSGSRSGKAVTLLSKVGFTNVYTMIDGYEGSEMGPGWKKGGFPASKKLDKSKVYQEGF